MFLFHDALNTFYLLLYGVGHMIKHNLDGVRKTPLSPHHGILFPISSKGIFLYALFSSLYFEVLLLSVLLSCL